MTEQTLQDTLTVKAGDKEFTITMYAGVLNKAMAAIGGIQGIDTFPVDSEKQNALVKILLTEYDNDGKEKGAYANAFTLPLTTYQEIMDWGFQHCVNFIQKTAQKMVKTVDDGAKAMEKASTALKAG